MEFPIVRDLGFLAEHLVEQLHDKKTLQVVSTSSPHVGSGGNRLTHKNSTFIPFHRKDAAALGIESGPIRRTTPFYDATARVTG
jgi:hypothetical protein